MITPRNLTRHEFIGLGVRVVEATNPALRGIAGTVVDETRQMIAVASGTRVRRVAKVACVFRFTLPDGSEVEVPGRALVAPPERRIAREKRRER
ncbi:MAG: ribonuclease P protein component 1 [Methanomicrobiales archaeon]|nr:ribonuclease P protein component 1 [Methanomicrobiales archaeon]